MGAENWIGYREFRRNEDSFEASYWMPRFVAKSW